VVMFLTRLPVLQAGKITRRLQFLPLVPKGWAEQAEEKPKEEYQW